MTDTDKRIPFIKVVQLALFTQSLSMSLHCRVHIA